MPPAGSRPGHDQGTTRSGRLLEALAATLDELRLTALERLYGVEIDAGRHHESVAELTGRVQRFPLRDGLVRQLLTALARAGRRSDGPAVYRCYADRHPAEPSPAARTPPPARTGPA
ncbi:BTAD domain-containing putative transcriptional regulator [Kitasatospora sp. NPDC048239]|uniref:BTAD domain-containing putative transcriptional regulator n=1 Tax=Kitasatospora sp. NPDC048239 TaxID=3364046 RepID=UPI00371AFEA5